MNDFPGHEKKCQCRVNKKAAQVFYCLVFQLTHRFPLHPLGGQRAGGDGRATAEGFEPSIHDLPLVVHLNLSKPF